MAVGGTVTEVRGDQVWALGHPFLGGGSFAIPLARARVVAVLPSSFSSVKFFDVGETIGTLEVDRAHGVWGRLGESPKLVDVAVEANKESYAFQCVRHPVLFPVLLGYLAHASHGARGRVFGDQTVGVRIEIAYRGLPEVVMEETYSGAGASAMVTTVTGDFASSKPYLDCFTSPITNLPSRMTAMSRSPTGPSSSFSNKSRHGANINALRASMSNWPNTRMTGSSPCSARAARTRLFNR